MKYTETHEWIEVEGSFGTVGVTHHAQKELGDIVHVELPKIGKEVKAGQEVVVLESTKAAADVYSPVSGIISAVNEALKEDSGLVNRLPETDGWLFKIQIKELEEIEKLLDPDSYELLIK
jgi:glycine cleavage system H protein